MARESPRYHSPRPRAWYFPSNFGRGKRGTPTSAPPSNLTGYNDAFPPHAALAQCARASGWKQKPCAPRPACHAPWPRTGTSCSTVPFLRQRSRRGCPSGVSAAENDLKCSDEHKKTKTKKWYMCMHMCMAECRCHDTEINGRSRRGSHAGWHPLPCNAPTAIATTTAAARLPLGATPTRAPARAHAHAV